MRESKISVCTLGRIVGSASMDIYAPLIRRSSDYYILVNHPLHQYRGRLRQWKGYSATGRSNR